VKRGSRYPVNESAHWEQSEARGGRSGAYDLCYQAHTRSIPLILRSLPSILVEVTPDPARARMVAVEDRPPPPLGLFGPIFHDAPPDPMDLINLLIT
jgi:hypothetical protein